jgi:hypothetical protein
MYALGSQADLDSSFTCSIWKMCKQSRVVALVGARQDEMIEEGRRWWWWQRQTLAMIVASTLLEDNQNS